MRVLQVSDFFPPVRGGLEGYVDDLAGALAARGHEVHVATLTPHPRASHPDVATHVVHAAATKLLPYEDSSRPFHPPLPDPTARRALGELVRRLRPDVVHAHSWLGISVPRASGTPLVLTAHDYALVCQLRTLVRPDGSICSGPSLECLRSGRSSYGAVASALMAAGTSVGRRYWKPAAVMTLSHEVRRAIAGHVRRDPVVVGGLLPAADPTATGSLPSDLPSQPYAMFAGDPGRHKGLQVVLEAWAGADRPQLPLVLAITRPLDAAPPPGVTVVTLTRAQMSAAWRRAALAVVPSLWREPFGMVAMEALAAGTPVVASRTGALPEIVRDGVDGVLVEPGDAAALQHAVRQVTEEGSRLAAMGKAAADGASRFAAETVVPRVEAVYESVVSGRGLG